MNLIVVTSTKQNIKFGYEGEDNVTKIIFPYDESWLEYGEGNFEVRILRCGDEVAYTATDVVDDRQAMTLTMTVTDIELSVRGRGEMQLCYVCPDSIKKSPIYQYTVNRSVDYKYAVDPPEGSIIASVEKSLSEIKNTTNRLSNSVISIESSINDVNSQIDNINNKISEFDEEIDSVGEVETKVDNLETSIESINGRINTAEGNINENTESISDLNESVTELENKKVTDLETSGGKSDSGKYLTVGTDGKIKATSLTIPPKITVDESLSTTSKNPVQNKVIKTELNNINSNIATCNTEISKINGSLGNLGEACVTSNYDGNVGVATITKGKGISASGSNVTMAYACRTTLITIQAPTVLFVVPAGYQYKINVFTQSSSLSGGTLLEEGIMGGVPHVVSMPDTAVAFVLTFFTENKNTSYTMTDTDAQTIHDGLGIMYEKARSQTYALSTKFEHMTMQTTGNPTDRGLTVNRFYEIIRQQKYIKVLPYDTVSIALQTGETATLFEYGFDMTNVKKTTDITADTPIKLSPKTYYIKFLVSLASEERYALHMYRTVSVTSIQAPTLVFNQKIATSRRCIFAVPYSLPQTIPEGDEDDYTASQHEIGYSAGILMLPDTYTVDGDPTRLIIFCHSSGYYFDFAQYEFEINLDIFGYFLAEGYAVFDTYGHSNFVTPDATKPRVYGNPDNMACYSAGYKWVIDNYNIRTDGVYVSGKSLGGSPAMNITFGKCGIPVKACGLMAPGLNFVRKGFGYNQGDRYENAQAFGLTDYTDALGGSGTIASVLARESFQNLMDAQYEKFCAWVPFWENTDGVLNNKADFLASAYLGVEGTDVSTGDGDVTRWANYSKHCDVPIKIWCAVDDANVPYRASYNFVHMLKNGGSMAELRTLKSGTGGHNAMNFNEETSEKVGDVVTASGVVISGVTAGYYELIQFFRRFQ